MEIQKINNQSFGALKYSPDYTTIKNFVASHYSRDVNETMGILSKLQASNPVDIYLSIYKAENGQQLLRAEIEGNTFTEGFFTSAKRVLKKAGKYANKLFDEKLELDRLLNRR